MFLNESIILLKEYRKARAVNIKQLRYEKDCDEKNNPLCQIRHPPRNALVSCREDIFEMTFLTELSLKNFSKWSLQTRLQVSYSQQTIPIIKLIQIWSLN